MNRRKIVRKYLQELLTADFPSQQQRDYIVYIVDKRDKWINNIKIAVSCNRGLYTHGEYD